MADQKDKERLICQCNTGFVKHNYSCLQGIYKNTCCPYLLCDMLYVNKRCILLKKLSKTFFEKYSPKQ